MGDEGASLTKPLLAYFTIPGSLACVAKFMCYLRLLCVESTWAVTAIKRPCALVQAKVHLEIGFTHECAVRANGTLERSYNMKYPCVVTKGL
mmetsp:Transcript_4347/g.8345  ORF Transcript_4347/g.8345 Transcript_4347/m.8345 type:complete len:92 (+) Transcript_4347:162-437(+)